MKNFRLVLFVFTLFLISTLNAQTFSGSFIVGSPQGDFSDQNDNYGYGLQLQGTFPSPGVTSPVVIGISANFMIFSLSDERQRVRVGFFDFEQQSDLSSNMSQFHLFVQLAPFPGSFKPYVEVLGGGNLLWTTATVKLRDVDNFGFDEDRFDKSDSFTDFTWSYGAGAGVMILLSPMPTLDLYLDLKVRYLRGGEAEFVRTEDTQVDFDNGIVYFSPRKANTDLMSFHLGVSLFF